MNTRQTIPSPPEGQDLATVPMRFEVTPLPVTDSDRAKAFYQRLGWRLDIDLQFTEQIRGVQFTPPGSLASIQFGPAGATPLQRLLLVVEDIEAARAELVDRGAASTSARSGTARRGSPPSPAATRRAAPTSARPPSPTPTATSGSCRRSPIESQGGSSHGCHCSRAAPAGDRCAPRRLRGRRPAPRLGRGAEHASVHHIGVGMAGRCNSR
jgi:predicted enzyme related to lactoylglutathione lyase